MQENELAQKIKSRSDKEKDRKKKTISLYTILEIQEKNFAVNDETKKVYEDIR